jgi:ATP-dependent RNA helicase DDX3X
MIDVVQEGSERIKPIQDFKDAGLHPVMLRNTQLAGYLKPTPIQRYTLPAIFEGKDLIACAQTGKHLAAPYVFQNVLD